MATPPLRLTSADVRELARLSGLEIDPAREDLVLEDLNGQFASLPLIDALLPAPNPVAQQPYDPTFPPVPAHTEVSR